MKLYIQIGPREIFPRRKMKMQKTAKYYWRMRPVEYIRIDTPPTSCVCENNKTVKINK